MEIKDYQKQVLTEIFKENTPVDIEDKLALLRFEQREIEREKRKRYGNIDEYVSPNCNYTGYEGL